MEEGLSAPASQMRDEGICKCAAQSLVTMLMERLSLNREPYA